jgi:hypothetical protein
VAHRLRSGALLNWTLLHWTLLFGAFHRFGFA